MKTWSMNVSELGNSISMLREVVGIILLSSGLQEILRSVLAIGIFNYLIGIKVKQNMI